MNKMSAPLRLLWVLWFAVLCASSGSAWATATFATRLNNFCATQPIQSVAPQQSKPFLASGNSCALCHTSSRPAKTDMNSLGTASKTCTGSTCGATVNPFCVATAPGSASITAPTAGASVALGQSLTFTGATTTNPDGFPLTYRWSFSNGQPTATGQSTAVPMNITGPVTATLTVLNSVGMVATGVAPTRAVTVTGTPTGNQAPTASINAPAGNTMITPGASVNFQGAGTDPDGNTPLTYAWSFPGGSPATSSAQNPGAVSYTTAGTYTASLTVTDAKGLASVPATLSVTVAAVSQKLTAFIDTPCINVSVLPGAKVTFKGSASASANQPLSYNWRFTGGNPSSSKVQKPGSVSYAKAGVYTATLTVTDSKGTKFEAATRVVTVASANQAGPTVGQCAIGGDDDDNDDDEKKDNVKKSDKDD